MGPPDAQGPPPAPPSSELQLALEQAVQDLVDRTGRPAHELAATLEALLRQGRFNVPKNSPTSPPPIDRSIDQIVVEDLEISIDRAEPCGQAVDTPQDVQDPLRWAETVARRLGDPDGVLCFRSFARRYPRHLLERALADALAVPDAKIRRSRAALFVALVGARARGAKRRSRS